MSVCRLLLCEPLSCAWLALLLSVRLVASAVCRQLAAAAVHKHACAIADVQHRTDAVPEAAASRA